MSHTTRMANGIDVETWDESRNQQKVQSEGRKLAASFPRDGQLNEEGAEIDEIRAPTYPGGKIQIWMKGPALNWSPPTGYQISEISVFESKYTCVTLEQV